MMAVLQSAMCTKTIGGLREMKQRLQLVICTRAGSEQKKKSGNLKWVVEGVGLKVLGLLLSDYNKADLVHMKLVISY